MQRLQDRKLDLAHKLEFFDPSLFDIMFYMFFLCSLAAILFHTLVPLKICCSLDGSTNDF